MIGLIISGLPASGKGTQCKKVASKYDLVHLNTGEILRQETEKNSEIGKETQKYISEGKFVPDELIEEIIEKEIRKNEDQQGFVFDGFPRSISQARILEKMGDQFGLKIKAMIYLEVELGEILNRIQKRAEETERKDDQEMEIVRKRIDKQREKSKELIDFYQKKNIYYQVDGNPSIEEVYENIKEVIQKNRLLEEK